VFALAPLLCAAQIGALLVTGARLAGRASVRALTPLLALWLAQALWFTLPYACLQFGWLQGLDVLVWRNNNHYFMWIALAHAAQYMWVTAYFARQSGAQRSLRTFWGKATVAGAAVWTLPLLLFWQPGFALLSPDAGIFVLVAAFANLHHFVLDGAIWKLRGPIARVLIQSPARGAAGARAAPPVARARGLGSVRRRAGREPRGRAARGRLVPCAAHARSGRGPRDARQSVLDGARSCQLSPRDRARDAASRRARSRARGSAARGGRHTERGGAALARAGEPRAGSTRGRGARVLARTRSVVLAPRSAEP